MRQLGAGNSGRFGAALVASRSLERRVYCCRQVSPAEPSDRYARSSSAASVERDPLRRDAEPMLDRRHRQAARVKKWSSQST
jgi:hypothetical protein